MQYNSVSEYFSKLQSRSAILLLSSLLLFVILGYFALMRNLTTVIVEEDRFLFATIFSLVAVIDVGLALFLARVLLQKTRTVVSLGERMDSYARSSSLRFVILLSSAFVLVVAYFLTVIMWLLILCTVIFFILWMVWPTRSLLCRELKLKPNECEVVFGK